MQSRTVQHVTANLAAAQLVLTAFVLGGVQRAQARRDERGVVSIEYLVLGAALIVLIGVLATNGTVQTALSNAFSNLFTKAGGA